MQERGYIRATAPNKGCSEMLQDANNGFLHPMVTMLKLAAEPAEMLLIQTPGICRSLSFLSSLIDEGGKARLTAPLRGVVNPHWLFSYTQQCTENKQLRLAN